MSILRVNRANAGTQALTSETRAPINSIVKSVDAVRPDDGQPLQGLAGRQPPYESPTIRAEAQVPYSRSRTFGFGRASTTDPFTAKTRCVPNVIIFPLTSQSFLINLGNVWMLRTFFQAHWTF